MRRISSRQNPLVAQYKSVAQGDVPTLMLLDGPHLVQDALAAGLRFEHLLVSPEGLEHADISLLVDRAQHSNIDVVVATAPVMAAASPVRSASAIVGLVHRPTQEVDIFSGSAPFVIVACDIQDPGNLGAIVRVAEAAGASGLIAAGQSADPFGWKALRGSMGSALRLPIARVASVTDGVAAARRHGCTVVAAVPRAGQSLFDSDLRGRIAVLVGGEGSGLPDEIIDAADVRVTIPMAGHVESLNAATTAALMAYEARRQRA